MQIYNAKSTVKLIYHSLPQGSIINDCLILIGNRLIQAYFV